MPTSSASQATGPTVNFDPKENTITLRLSLPLQLRKPPLQTEGLQRLIEAVKKYRPDGVPPDFTLDDTKMQDYYQRCGILEANEAGTFLCDSPMGRKTLKNKARANGSTGLSVLDAGSKYPHSFLHEDLNVIRSQWLSQISSNHDASSFGDIASIGTEIINQLSIIAAKGVEHLQIRWKFPLGGVDCTSPHHIGERIRSTYAKSPDMIAKFLIQNPHTAIITLHTLCTPSWKGKNRQGHSEKHHQDQVYSRYASGSSARSIGF